MFRRPRPLFLISTVLFVALTLRLGVWQLQRGHAKQALAVQQAAADRLAPQAWQGELGEAAWQRRFQVRGRWLAAGQIFLDNRIHAGRAGFHVLTPLQLENGRSLLVNRGWLPKRAGVMPEAVPPAGDAVLIVRMQPPTQHYVELAANTVNGAVWQNLDWQRYRGWSGLRLVDALPVQLDASDSLLRDWPAADLGVEKHYAYAGQWFLFAALAVVFLGVFHWKKRVD